MEATQNTQFPRIMGIDVTDGKTLGMVCALADGNTESLVSAFGSMLAKANTFDAYEAIRLSWREGYKEQRSKITADGLDTAWRRFVSAVKESGITLPDKPKATGAAATKKAKQRASDPFASCKTTAQVDATLAKVRQKVTDPVAILKAEGKASMRKGAIAEAAKRAADAAAADRLKGRRDTLGQFVKSCAPDVVALLECIVDGVLLKKGDRLREAGTMLASMADALDVAPATGKGKGRKAA